MRRCLHICLHIYTSNSTHTHTHIYIEREKVRSLPGVKGIDFVLHLRRERVRRKERGIEAKRANSGDRSVGHSLHLLLVCD